MIKIRKTDPRLKIIFSAAIIILAIIISKTLAMILLTGVIITIALKGRYLSKLFSYLSPLGILVPILFIINLFFYADGKVFASIDLKIFELALTSGGLKRSMVIASRLISIAFSAAWLVVTTPPYVFSSF